MSNKYSMGEKGNSEHWRFAAVLLLLLCLGLAIALTVVSVVLSRESEKQTGPTAAPVCGNAVDEIDFSEPENPSVFSDLTKTELEAISQYLFDQPDLTLTKHSEATINSTFIHVIELLMPDKLEALNHLDNNAARPERWAKVILFRGNVNPPEVQEYKVGPLPNPTSHVLLDFSQRRKNPVPFSVRPSTAVEYIDILIPIWIKLYSTLGFIIYESFGVALADCKDRCLTFSEAPVSTSILGSFTRQVWVGFDFQTEFHTLHPVDLQVLMILDGADKSKFNLSTVWYNQQMFESMEDLVQQYTNGSINKLHTPFPTEEERAFSTMNLRGDVLEKESRRPPRQIEPDGKRYTVKHQKVEYLGWSFNYRMSTITGPMLLDVKYRNNRIAYEVSLQEVVVFYSGKNPLRRLSNFVDSVGLLGYSCKTLVPGTDCPYHATLLPARHQTSSENSSVVYQNAFCLFEQNTGVPLRRHHSYTADLGSFYSGMMDDVLTLRTIVTVANYDYVFDFIFHQNGVVEVKGISTGYIISSVYSPDEDKYGFRLNDRVLGNIHHHMFNFKVDIDINGQENRFETLDIETEEADNTDWATNPGASTYPQIMFKRNLKTNELDAAYKFNFEAPKYLTFYNEDSKDKYGNPKAYRIAIEGMSKQTLPIGQGHEPSISWSRYQVAVTKFHQQEPSSSSIYAAFDALDPVVDFQSFLDDNDTIVDQDLVAWVTLGVHHIPHTEDLPVTPTTGGQLSFFLSPYNYFQEDPSMASRSAVRIDLTNTALESQVNISRYGLDPDVQCVPELASSYDESVKADRSPLFPKE